MSHLDQLGAGHRVPLSRLSAAEKKELLAMLRERRAVVVRRGRQDVVVGGQERTITGQIAVRLRAALDELDVNLGRGVRSAATDLLIEDVIAALHPLVTIHHGLVEGGGPAVPRPAIDGVEGLRAAMMRRQERVTFVPDLVRGLRLELPTFRVVFETLWKGFDGGIWDLLPEPETAWKLTEEDEALCPRLRADRANCKKGHLLSYVRLLPSKHPPVALRTLVSAVKDMERPPIPLVSISALVNRLGWSAWDVWEMLFRAPPDLLELRPEDFPAGLAREEAALLPRGTKGVFFGNVRRVGR